MNEWFYKKSFSNLLVVIVFSILLLWGTVGYCSSIHYKAKYRSAESELGQLRTELQSVVDTKSELERELGTISTITDEAVGFVRESEDLLIQSGTTITEIRAQIQDLVTYCNRLELLIYSIYDNTNNIHRSE